MNDYRGKKVDDGEWVYGFIDWEIRDDGGKDYYIHTGYDKGYEEFELVDYTTIGQSIGFEDKNGKMIYAGDMRRHIKEKYKEEIYWDEFCVAFRVRGEDRRCYSIDASEKYDYEIIGNIHEDKE